MNLAALLISQGCALVRTVYALPLAFSLYSPSVPLGHLRCPAFSGPWAAAPLWDIFKHGASSKVTVLPQPAKLRGCWYKHFRWIFLGLFLGIFAFIQSYLSLLFVLAYLRFWDRNLSGLICSHLWYPQGCIISGSSEGEPISLSFPASRMTFMRWLTAGSTILRGSSRQHHQVSVPCCLCLLYKDHYDYVVSSNTILGNLAIYRLSM